MAVRPFKPGIAGKPGCRFPRNGRSQLRQEGVQRRRIRRRRLDADQGRAEIHALVAVVEQADVPVRRHGRQEFHQRARTLRELETEQAFARRQRRAAADHVADVLLGQLVVAQVAHVEAFVLQGPRDVGGLAPARDLHADEDMGAALVGDAVVELGDVALPDHGAEAAEAAALFRQRDGEAASRASPTSARSATKRMRSKFMLAPEVMATSDRPLSPSRST